jgi:hypothetical protein
MIFLILSPTLNAYDVGGFVAARHLAAGESGATETTTGPVRLAMQKTPSLGPRVELGVSGLGESVSGDFGAVVAIVGEASLLSAKGVGGFSAILLDASFGLSLPTAPKR